MRRGPCQCAGVQFIAGDPYPEMCGVTVDHREIIVLIALMEAKPQTEAIRQRDFLLYGFRRIDGCRALILHHVARHEMAAIRGCIEKNISGPALDAALEHRLEGLVARVVLVEGTVVAIEQEAPPGAAQ